MYTMAIGKMYSAYDTDQTYADFLQPMVAWINHLPGAEIYIEGYEEGVIDSVKSLAHSIVGDNLVCTVLVNVKETGPIVEKPETANEQGERGEQSE